MLALYCCCSITTRFLARAPRRISHTFPGSDAGPQLFAMDHFTGTLSPREEVSSVTSVHSSRFITVTCLQGLVFVCVFCIITQPFPVLGTLFSEKCTCHIAQTLVHHFGVQILELDFAFFSLTSHSKSSSWGLHQAVHLNGNPLTFFWADAGGGFCQQGLLATVSWCTSRVTASTTQFHVSLVVKAHSPALCLASGFRIFIPNEKKHWH